MPSETNTQDLSIPAQIEALIAHHKAIHAEATTAAEVIALQDESDRIIGKINRLLQQLSEKEF